MTETYIYSHTHIHTLRFTYYIHTVPSGNLFFVSVCIVELHDELVLLCDGLGDVAQLSAEGGHGFLVTHDLDISSF